MNIVTIPPSLKAPLASSRSGHNKLMLQRLFRDGLDVVEYTNERLVLRERPHTWAAVVFALVISPGFVRCVDLAIDRYYWAAALGSGLVLPILALALYALVDSTIVAERSSDTVFVRRRLLWFRWTRAYPVHSITDVEVQQRPTRIRMRLSNGKWILLMLSDECGSFVMMEQQAAALLHVICQMRHAHPRHGGDRADTSSH